MKAILATNYGSPDVLQMAEVEKPAAEDDRVLVEIQAASLNIADLYNLKGGVGRLSGGLFKPKDPWVVGILPGGWKLLAPVLPDFIQGMRYSGHVQVALQNMQLPVMIG